MIPIEAYEMPKKIKFRPVMSRKMSRRADGPGPFGYYHLDKDGGYFQAGGMFPVMVCGHKKIVVGATPHHHHRHDKRPGKKRLKQAESRFGMIPGQFIQNTLFITEAPQGADKVGAMYEEDPTQVAVMKHALSTAGKKNRLVCAGGRSACDEQGRLHHMMSPDHSANHNMINYGEINEDRIQSLAARYLRHVLLKSSGNVSQFISEITDMTGQTEGISPGLVIQRTTDRVLRLVSRLTEEQRKAMEYAVMKALKYDITDAMNRYHEGLAEWHENQSEYQQDTYEKLAGIRPQQALIPEEAYQKLVNEISREGNDKLEALRMKEVESYKINLLLALTEVFSNILLLAEVAGTDAENIVVTYSEKHMKPLKYMIGQFRRLQMKHRQ